MFSRLVLNEVAVERKLADEWVDLPQRQRRWQSALDVATQKAVGRHVEVERSLRGFIDDVHAVFLRE